MVFTSAVTPAPDEGSNPAMVRTTGGGWAIGEMYQFQVRARAGHVGTAALGCPVERSSTDFGALTRGASLRRTAEGGCPHVLIACCTSGTLAPTSGQNLSQNITSGQT